MSRIGRQMSGQKAVIGTLTAQVRWDDTRLVSPWRNISGGRGVVLKP
jgi:hypothetical protein